VGPYKLSQIQHPEMRLEGILVGVDGWLSSVLKYSHWNHHQFRMLFENYPEFKCLATLVITIEKFADRRVGPVSSIVRRPLDGANSRIVVVGAPLMT
jgi:hypothetical protein